MPVRTAITKHEESAATRQSSRRFFRSPLRYPGGKQKAIEQIAAQFPPSAREYREPMVGGGSVFLHARSVDFAGSYWLNDKFRELMTFWRTLQDRRSCERLMEELVSLHSSFADADEIKRYFLRAREEKPADAFREALLFFFFNRVTFSGTTRAGGFSSSASQRRFTLSSIDRLATMPDALENVRLSNDDFEQIICAPGKDVFIFLDPPYYTASRLYGRNGSLHEFDHEKLAHLLSKTSHRFLITYDDCAEIRRLYKGMTIKKWSLQYGMNNCNLERESKIGSELFIRNY